MIKHTPKKIPGSFLGSGAPWPPSAQNRVQKPFLAAAGPAPAPSTAGSNFDLNKFSDFSEDSFPLQKNVEVSCPTGG
jgi:hypothetical protein